MDSKEDKQWASRYLLDPLTAPEPSEETGPGTSFNSTFAKAPSSASSRGKPTPSTSIRSVDSRVAHSQTDKSSPSVSVRSSTNPYRNGVSAYPSPPPSADHSKERFSIPDARQGQNRDSIGQASTQVPTSTGGQASTMTSGTHVHRRRTSSLNQRFQGDLSHQPLDIIRQETKRAQRSPHLRKKHHVGADSIDSLDNVANSYHHEGPYDATLLARNTSLVSSPVAAVSRTNQETLKATPVENINDSLRKHRPLDGVAIIPPGTTDQLGRTYRYQEGTDMMIEGQPEGGAYKRWPGIKYLPEDLKGKGEPSYSLEKALKHDKHSHRRNRSDGIEMTTQSEHRRPMSANSDARRVSDTTDANANANWQGNNHQRSSSGTGGSLRRRFGSLRV